MDVLMLAAVLIAVAAVLIVIFVMLAGTEKKVHRSLGGRRRAGRKKRNGGVCGICFGEITNNDVIARCACSQTFHDTCARPTGKCPYCGRPYDELKTELPDCVKCPSCGEDVVGNVCSCGAVVNRGGFVCACGNELNINDPVCGRCGREYKVRSGRGDNELQ
ncbi:MAG: hypothetical protein FWH44_01385 [Methanomassiliicoccaceae archaeon]|nr:hypothetical protein [Methanomassiliicoccaceae archaeon]